MDPSIELNGNPKTSRSNEKVSKADSVQYSESDFDGFSVMSSSPLEPVLRTLRNRQILGTVEEISEDDSDHFYVSDDCGQSSSSKSTIFDKDEERPRLKVLGDEILQDPKETEAKSETEGTYIDPSAYEIEIISDLNDSVVECETDSLIIKEEIDIEDYVYYTDDELEEKIIRLDKGR